MAEASWVIEGSQMGFQCTKEGRAERLSHLIYVTPAQLLHFLKMDLGLGLALLAHPPPTALPVETETAAEDQEA